VDDQEHDRTRPFAQNGEGLVEVTHRSSGVGHREETVIKREEKIVDPKEPVTGVPAIVGVTKKLTMNLGNYESATVVVSLSMPCKPDDEAVEAMHAKVNKWVDIKMEAERAAIRK
jgi:hypothetical protein